ncbi:hypothetical protein LSAT2_022132 [Lamellibrachia satsuma]|nr:hypothetical protein LSAT2_022132 [Lamellibrachia satsuma]
MSPVCLFFTRQVLMEKTRNVSRLPVLYSTGTDGKDTRCQPCWGKAGRRWVGSYTVEEILKKVVYRLKNGNRNVLSSSVNSSRLKRYREADDDDNQPPASRRRRYTYPVAVLVLNPDPATDELEKPHIPSGSGGYCTSKNIAEQRERFLVTVNPGGFLLNSHHQHINSSRSFVVYSPRALVKSACIDLGNRRRFRGRRMRKPRDSLL